jgi:chromosome segregation ATPase
LFHHVRTAKGENLDMAAESTEGRPVASWMQMLDQIEASLTNRLAQVQEPPAPAAEAGPSAKESLQALDERLARMHARLEQAERDAAEADEALRTESEAHQRWTETMTAARRWLADWAAGVK